MFDNWVLFVDDFKAKHILEIEEHKRLGLKSDVFDRMKAERERTELHYES